MLWLLLFLVGSLLAMHSLCCCCSLAHSHLVCTLTVFVGAVLTVVVVLVRLSFSHLPCAPTVNAVVVWHTLISNALSHAAIVVVIRLSCSCILQYTVTFVVSAIDVWLSFQMHSHCCCCCSCLAQLQQTQSQPPAQQAWH